MLARWSALLILSLGLVSPLGGAMATGGSKGTETGQTAASTRSDKPSHSTTAQTGDRSTEAAPSANPSERDKEKQ